jgi:hypothetical protein
MRVCVYECGCITKKKLHNPSAILGLLMAALVVVVIVVEIIKRKKI